jgi:hypothetical protein
MLKELISGDDMVLHRKGYIKKEQIKAMTVTALVDSSAYMLAVNQTVKAQLDLEVISEEIATLADGSQINR